MPSYWTPTLTIVGSTIRAELGGRQADGTYRPPLSDAELEELTWYMEADLTSLFGPTLRRAEKVAAGLSAIGDRLYAALAPTPEIAWLLDSGLAESAQPAIVIVAEAPALAVPWELASVAREQDRRPLAAVCEIVRAPLSAGVRLAEPSPPPRESPLRVLVVSPRPRGRHDVPLHATQGPTLGAALSFRDEMSLDIVRPPTLEALRTYAAAAPYDLIHFDGHGVTDENGAIALLFESPIHRSELVSGLDFATAIELARPPLILLNACRSSFAETGSQSSLAGTIAARIPDAAVVAMQYAVEPALVSALLTTFYPTLIETGNAHVALARVRRALVNAFVGTAQRLSKPHFITPTTFRAQAGVSAPVRQVRAARPARSVKRPPPSAESVLLWAELLWEIDRALAQPDANVLLTGIIGSGKSTVARAYAEYALLTGAFTRVEFGGDASARNVHGHSGQDSGHARRAERLLTIDDYDGPVPPARTRRDRGPEAVGEVSHATLTCGRSWTKSDAYSGHIELLHPPLEVLKGTLLRFDGGSTEAWSTRTGRGLASALIRLGQEHLGGLEVLIRLAEEESLASALRRVEWGADDLPATPAVEAVSAVLNRLDETELATFAVLGLYQGAVHPNQLAILTAGGLHGDPFLSILGRHITAAEWRSALRDGVELGLFDALDESEQLVRIVPLVGAMLRGRLRALAGSDDALAQLQFAMAWATVGEVRAWQRMPLWAPPDETEWYRRQAQLAMLTVREANMGRALAIAIRGGHDDLAVATADAYFEAGAGSELFERGLLVTSFVAEEHPDAYRDCVALRATVSTASMLDASWRGEWDTCVSAADAAIELELATEAPPSRIVLILTTKARALSLLERADEAERALKEAFAHASDDGERREVDEAAQDVTHNLMLNEELTRAPRLRVGLGTEPAKASSDRAAAHDAEARGDHDTAAELWLRELRSSELKRDAIGAAAARDELGRLAAMFGDPGEARFRLESALTLRSTLGLKTARTLYFLGMAAEAAGDFDEAEEWLMQSLAQSPPASSLSADCLYELGLVELRRNEVAKARELLERALGDYQRLGLGRYVTDTWLMLAQLEAIDGNEDRALEYFKRVLGSSEASEQTLLAARKWLGESS